MKREFITYLMVGVVNTLVGLGTTFIGLEILALHYLLANAVGYGFGLICSYFLNRTITFRSPHRGARHFVKFLIFFFISYALGQLLLILLVEQFQMDEFLATIFGMGLYTLVSFYLNRKFVF